MSGARGANQKTPNLFGDGRGILALADDAAPEPGLAADFGGVVLSEAAFDERLPDGEPYAENLTRQGILPGVRVDTGVHPLAGFPGEHVTEGLDGLRSRLADLASRGARFATWRSLLRVGDRLPSRPASRANAHAMARFSALCHEIGVMPVLEPELSTHSPALCAAATAVVLTDVFGELRAAGLRRHPVVLAPALVLPGTDQDVIGVLRAVVPDTVSCVAIRGDRDTVAALGSLPWPVTFLATTGPREVGRVA